MIDEAGVAIHSLVAIASLSHSFWRPFISPKSFFHCLKGHPLVLAPRRRSVYAALVSAEVSFSKTIVPICMPIQPGFRQPSVGTSLFISCFAIATAQAMGF